MRSGALPVAKAGCSFGPCSRPFFSPCNRKSATATAAQVMTTAGQTQQPATGAKCCELQKGAAGAGGKQKPKEMGAGSAAPQDERRDDPSESRTHLLSWSPSSLPSNLAATGGSIMTPRREAGTPAFSRHPVRPVSSPPASARHSTLRSPEAVRRAHTARAPAWVAGCGLALARHRTGE